MKRLCVVPAVAVLLLISGPSASAQMWIPYDLVCCGSGEMSGPNHTVIGSVAEACVGEMSGPSNSTSTGFWYLPGWIMTGVDNHGDVSVRTSLGLNHPNPFNPTTTLRYQLASRVRVSIKLYDIAGREVMTLVDREIEAGEHGVTLSADGLSSGVYLVRMVAGDYVGTGKLLLLK
jgi:hypothetical protein